MTATAIFPPAHPACSMPATKGHTAAGIAAVGPAAIIRPVQSAITTPARRPPAETGIAAVGKSVAEPISMRTGNPIRYAVRPEYNLARAATL